MEGKVGVVVRSNAEASSAPAAAVKMQALGSGKGELGDDDDDERPGAFRVVLPVLLHDDAWTKRGAATVELKA